MSQLCELLIALTLVAAFFIPVANLSAQEVDNSERYISIQMDRVANAQFYEVEIAPYETRGLKTGIVYKIYDEDPKVYTRLKPGKYAVRTRSLGNNQEIGAWGQWAPFDVAPKKQDSLYPTEGQKVYPMAKDKEKIIFHWPHSEKSSEGSTDYQFALKKNGKTVDSHSSSTNWTEAEISPESKYEWSVNGFVTTHRFETLASPKDGRVVTIDVNGDPAAVLYQYELVKFTPDNKPGSPSIVESQEARFKMRLSPGLYELRVRSVLATKAVSEWSRPERFYVRLPYPVLVSPENKVTMEPVDNWHNPVELKWQAVEGANRYYVRIVEKVTKNIVAIHETDTNFFIADVEHSHSYEWAVIALSYGEKPEEATLKSAPYREFTLVPYIKLSLSMAEESSHYYGWYRHWISNIQYVGRNYDQNSLYNQQIFGGTGELAVGHWHKNSRWGVLLDASLSGFIIDRSYYNYMSTGLSMGRRVLISEFSRLRYWFGVSYTEFPDFVVSPYDSSQLHFQRVKTYGPQAQISYLGEFSEDYGYHLYFHTYLPLAAVRTPNGNSFMAGPSLRFGVLGTWNYSENTKMMAGYSYRYETYGYTSYSALGARNSSEYAGHFLNLAIEFGLAKQKFK